MYALEPENAISRVLIYAQSCAQNNISLPLPEFNAKKLAKDFKYVDEWLGDRYIQYQKCIEESRDDEERLY